jgi:hypothetical protein
LSRVLRLTDRLELAADDGSDMWDTGGLCNLRYSLFINCPIQSGSGSMYNVDSIMTIMIISYVTDNQLDNV